MSESDTNWNPDDRDREPDLGPTAESTAVPDAPTAETPATAGHPEFAWPTDTWPPAPRAEATPPAEPTVPGAGFETGNAGSVSWPPTRPVAPTSPYAAGPYSPGPYSPGSGAAGPYAGPYGSPDAGTATNPGPWGAPLPGWSPAAPPQWPTAPAAGSAPPSGARRGLALLAALALVLASAGIGAAVAIAVHKNNNTQTFSSSGNANNGFGGNNFGGLGNGGLGNGTGGSSATTIPGGTGSLNKDAIAAKVNPALVDINTTLAQGRAAGTGMLISSSGEILTNNHVIADATSIKVTIGGTGATYNAKVVGYDVTEDVALVQITDKVSNLPTVVFGDPSKVQIGDPVVAIGNALGRGGTPTSSQGQVTKLDQQVTAGDEGGNQETLQGMIQINAPIQPGDSGGALVDSTGSIIGMNTAAAGGGQFNAQAGSNVGFAIPIDRAVGIVRQIRTGTETDKIHIGDRALLGVQVQDLNGQVAPVSTGALVVGVQANTGADSAGIQTNDVVVALDGNPVNDSASLRTLLVKFHPGDSVRVGWVDSNGTRHDASVKLIAGPPL